MDLRVVIYQNVPNNIPGSSNMNKVKNMSSFNKILNFYTNWLNKCKIPCRNIGGWGLLF